VYTKDPPAHVHKWQSETNEGWVVITPATCSAQGVEQRVCTAAGCTLTGSKETRSTELDPTAHSYDTTTWKKDGTNHWHACTGCNAVQPNSTAAHTGGSATCQQKATCEVCAQIYGNLGDHDYSAEYTVDLAETCTTTGTKSKHCQNCTEKTDEQTIPAKGHAWGEWSVTTAAGCTSAGSEKRVCANNAEHTETRAVNATGHSYTDEVTDPTCTEDGYTTYTCSNCGDSYTGDEVDATGHTYGAPVWRWNGYVSATATFTCGTCNHEEVKNASISRVTANASCTVAGDTTYTAKVTFEGNEYTDEKVSRGEKQPHTPVLVEESQPATCTEMGSGLYECEVCHEQYNGAIEALGHDIQQHEAQAPTCTEAGWNAYEACTRCDYTTKTEIAATGHDWASEWSNDETNHWHECTVCHEKKDDEAHTYDWVITKDPTEDEEGEKEEYCTVCEYANGNKETLAKLVSDDNGNVSDLPVLPPNQDYDLEIAVKESESKYNIEGLNKGYLVELFIVDGEDRNPYDDSKDVTLKLVIPDGMEDFTLYKMSGDRLTEISEEEYTVSGGVVTI
ncbi:MAG: hypothetical protein K2O67_06185, partial [Clostridia bacterium]|nr:hypothetical protein [Clostridia bacterium]